MSERDAYAWSHPPQQPEKATGEKLASADFYERFCAGEFDDRFGMRWATYFEAARVPARVSEAAPA